MMSKWKVIAIVPPHESAQNWMCALEVVLGLPSVELPRVEIERPHLNIPRDALMCTDIAVRGSKSPQDHTAHALPPPPKKRGKERNTTVKTTVRKRGTMQGTEQGGTTGPNCWVALPRQLAYDQWSMV